MLKKIRKTIAAVMLLLITLLFLDFTGTLHHWLSWLAMIQLVPAILAVNFGIILGLAILTFLFGRLYCSVICPLGIMQDGISHLSGKIKSKGRKKRFHYSPARTWLRYGFLGLFIIALIAGVSSIVSLLDPYANYGRIASKLLAPLYRLGNNLLAGLAERMDSYLFYSTEVWIKSGITLGVTIVILFIVALLSWKNGRIYCNTICPVGTVLGVISRFSIFKPTFTDQCTKCGLCEKSCKSSCIDAKNLSIDQSRCVTCFNCIDKCKFGGMKYAPAKTGKKKATQPASSVPQSQPAESSTEGLSRRSMLTLLGTVAITHTLKAQQLQVDGGLADIEDKKVPHRKTPLVPPGAQSLRNMKSHCTACQLCVSACPNNILRPSNKLSTFMQPEMSFERGYCRPECVECSGVCPSKAITPITTAEKTAISIGHAIWVADNCVVNTDNVQCTNCQRHCPTGAILLIAVNPEDKKSLKLPTVNNELCIGCGACEHHCPARPFSAIYIEGNVRHHIV